MSDIKQIRKDFDELEEKIASLLDIPIEKIEFIDGMYTHYENNHFQINLYDDGIFGILMGIWPKFEFRPLLYRAKDFKWKKAFKDMRKQLKSLSNSSLIDKP